MSQKHSIFSAQATRIVGIIETQDAGVLMIEWLLLLTLYHKSITFCNSYNMSYK